MKSMASPPSPTSNISDRMHLQVERPANEHVRQKSGIGLHPHNAGTTFVSAAPFAPPPRVETPPPPPSPLGFWQPGHWSWSGGQYVWMAGQYVQRPTPTANWAPGYWQQGPNGWVWTEGRWA